MKTNCSSCIDITQGAASFSEEHQKQLRDGLVSAAVVGEKRKPVAGDDAADAGGDAGAKKPRVAEAEKRLEGKLEKQAASMWALIDGFHKYRRYSPSVCDAHDTQM